MAGGITDLIRMVLIAIKGEVMPEAETREKLERELLELIDALKEIDAAMRPGAANPQNYDGYDSHFTAGRIYKTIDALEQLNARAPWGLNEERREFLKDLFLKGRGAEVPGL